MSDAEENRSNPFRCPVCGGSVACSGGGRKDCTECAWRFAPDTRTNTQQTGLTNYQ